MHIYVWALVKVIWKRQVTIWVKTLVGMGKARLLYYFGTWLATLYISMLHSR